MGLDPRLSFSPFFFFFLHAVWRGQNSLFTYCSWDSQSLYSEKNIKNGSHGTSHKLKNILLQCFQFSVSVKISCIQTDPKFHFLLSLN